MEKEKKVACVIVTYNRLNLLKQCVDAVRNQSYEDFDIIVVNNGSTDGTREWLNSNNDIIQINQNNVGGAGGFYSGMKRAYDDGYGWIWMMDDDGLPDAHQLENLMKATKRLEALCVNALVCDILRNGKLSFGLVYQGETINEVGKAQQYSEIPDSINPFNGTLICREIVKKIGFIKKEMFIWGDETEYNLRMKHNGFSRYTITDAIHYHPTAKGKKGNIIPFISKYKVNLKPKSKLKIYFRNIGYIYSTYDRKALKRSIKEYSIYYLCRFNIIGLASFYKSLRKGICNEFE